MAAETIIDAAAYSEARMRSGSDPLARAIRPPENESVQDREERLKLEAKAKKINDDIDEQIKLERIILKKRKQVNVLLLGQSESGKSTTLKRATLDFSSFSVSSWFSFYLTTEFQILHTPVQVSILHPPFKSTDTPCI